MEILTFIMSYPVWVRGSIIVIFILASASILGLLLFVPRNSEDSKRQTAVVFSEKPAMEPSEQDHWRQEWAAISIGEKGSIGKLEVSNNQIYGTTRVLENKGNIGSAAISNNIASSTLPPPIAIGKTSEFQVLSDKELKSIAIKICGNLRSMGSTEKYDLKISKKIVEIQAELLMRIQKHEGPPNDQIPPNLISGYLDVNTGSLAGASPLSDIANYIEFLAAKIGDAAGAR